MSPGSGVAEREVEVRVQSVVESGGARTRVEIRHRAETPRWAATVYRLVAARRIRRALDGIAMRVGQR